MRFSGAVGSGGNHNADLVTHAGLYKRPVQYCAAAQHQRLDTKQYLEFFQSECIVQRLFTSDDIGNTELAQKRLIAVVRLSGEHLNHMRGGGFVGQCAAFPAQTAGRVNGNIVHRRFFRYKVAFRHGSGIFIQLRLFVEGKVIIRSEAAGQPALMLIVGVFPEGDAIKHFARRLAFRYLHIPAHDFPIQRGHHVAENIGRSIYSLLHLIHLCWFVMTGMHWAFVPACLLALADPGYDVLLTVAMLSSNTAQAGATFGAAFKTRDPEMRQMAIPAGISALLAGVTEPAMYGVTLRLKKPMVAACIAGAVGGLISGIVNLKAYAFATPCLTAIVQFIAPDGGSNFMFACIVFAVVLVLSFILTPAHEAAEEPAAETSAVSAAPAAPVITGKIEIDAPIPGEVIPLSEVKDQTFASGVLGEGYAIVPSEGKVYAPFDGTCDNLFDTLHAMGLVSDSGVELLIHVGLETVGLNGAPFKAHIKSGDKFRKGDLLLEFDIDAIKAAGCETQTPVIVTNAEDVGSITIEGNKIVIGG